MILGDWRLRQPKAAPPLELSDLKNEMSNGQSDSCWFHMESFNSDR